MIHGFKKADTQIKHRMVLSVSGLEKQGKTSFALSAPGPIIYFNFDYGQEGVIHKYSSTKDIYEKGYRFSRIGNQDYTALWSSFTADLANALKSKARTIVIDTATDAWELLRLARFGKLSQVQSYHYGPVNAEYKLLVQDTLSFDKNVIFLHKLKKRYVDDKFTGEYERAGFSGTGYLVQANLEVFRDGLDGGFYMKVMDCRQNSDLGGLEIELPDCLMGFGFFAQMVFPDTSEEDWE